MTICINDSGTWRLTSTLCVNQSGTWRCINYVCVNKSETWRYVFNGIVAAASLGSNVEGGYLICKSGGTAFIVAPQESEVSRNFYGRNDAITLAQSETGCTDWFIPNQGNFGSGQLGGTMRSCRTYWDNYSRFTYWSNSTFFGYNYACACGSDFREGGRGGVSCSMSNTFCVRALRCVSY